MKKHFEYTNADFFKGNLIGMYLIPEKKIQYERTPTMFTNTRKSAFLFSSRKNANFFRGGLYQKKGTYVNEKLIPVFKGYKQGIVYKLNTLEEKNNEIKGPFNKSQNPLIEKIIYKEKEIYFSAINNKFVIYSIQNNEKNKKEIKIHYLEKINQEKNNQKELKKFALNSFKNLQDYEKALRTKNNLNTTPVYEFLWENFESTNLEKAA